MAQCACMSDDRYDCWALRYFGYAIGDTQRVEDDGGPCECSCHDDYDEDGGDWF